MKNLESVFAAYLIGWGILLVYYVTVGARIGSLKAELERLRNSANRSK
jgi:hypothetical protein